MTLLRGDVVVVTGAGHGIGRAVALAAAQAGARVVAGDIDLAAAQETVRMIALEDGEALALRCDVGDPAQAATLARSTAERFGAASVLVNNAGILRGAGIAEARFAQDWADTFRVNVDGPMHMVQALLPQLKLTRGRIVNICSTSAFLASDSGTAYAASKGALAQFTRALAVELGEHGIRVNAVAPGFVLTGIDGVPTTEEFADRYRSRTPLRRLAHAQDIAGPVVFLASELSSHVSAAILPVDGGYMAVSQMNRTPS